MMIACHQARDYKPRLLLLSHELCHAHHHPVIIMVLLRKAYLVVLQQGSRWPVAVCVPRRQFSLLAWYNKQLEKSPGDHQEYHIRRFAKKEVDGAGNNHVHTHTHLLVLFGLGDVIAQLISVEKGEKFKLDVAVHVQRSNASYHM